MALQESTTATSAYDPKTYTTIYDSSTFTTIDCGITSVSASKKFATFQFNMKLDGDIPKIQQADQSLLDLSDVEGALTNRGFRCNIVINGSFVEVGVFWD